MRIFPRKNRKETEELIAPSLEIFSSWIKFVVESYHLTKGNYTLAAGLGGFLLFIKNQGITWIPYSVVKNKLKKIETRDFAVPTALGSGIALAAILNVPLATLFFANITLKKLYPKLLIRPPKRIKRFLISEINEISVQILSIKKWKMAFERNDAVKDDMFDSNFIQKHIQGLNVTQQIYASILDDYEEQANLAIKIKVKVFFSESNSSFIEKAVSFIKSFISEEEPDEFLFPFQPNLIVFLGELERMGLQIEFKPSVKTS